MYRCCRSYWVWGEGGRGEKKGLECTTRKKVCVCEIVLLQSVVEYLGDRVGRFLSAFSELDQIRSIRNNTE